MNTGAGEMYADGLLASVDISRLAKAHLCVFEEMKRTATGRYICFDQILQSRDEIQELAQKTGRDINITPDRSISSSTRFELSNLKLSKVMSRTFRCNE